MSVLQELEKLNREITAAEREMNQAEGKHNAQVQLLEREFGIRCEQIDRTIREIEEEIASVAIDIEDKFKKLQEEYEW